MPDHDYTVLLENKQADVHNVRGNLCDSVVQLKCRGAVYQPPGKKNQECMKAFIFSYHAKLGRVFSMVFARPPRCA